jgi:hypothetical protein
MIMLLINTVTCLVIIPIIFKIKPLLCRQMYVFLPVSGQEAGKTSMAEMEFQHEDTKTRRKKIHIPVVKYFAAINNRTAGNAGARFQTRHCKPENLFLYIIIYRGKMRRGGNS